MKSLGVVQLKIRRIDLVRSVQQQYLRLVNEGSAHRTVGKKNQRGGTGNLRSIYILNLNRTIEPRANYSSAAKTETIVTLKTAQKIHRWQGGSINLSVA